MEKTFKCAESEEHVKEANIKLNDVQACISFIKHFAVATEHDLDALLEEAKTANTDRIHDMLHILLDDVMYATERNELGGAAQSLFESILPAMKKKQKACRLGKQDGHH